MMRPVPTLTGLLLIALGLVATISGELDQSWWWFVVAATAILGFTGLISSLTGGRASQR